MGVARRFCTAFCYVFVFPFFWFCAYAIGRKVPPAAVIIIITIIIAIIILWTI